MVDLGQYDARKAQAPCNGDKGAVFARFRARLKALENDKPFLRELEKKRLKLINPGALA